MFIFFMLVLLFNINIRYVASSSVFNFIIYIIDLFQVDRKRKNFTKNNNITSSNAISDVLIKVNFLASKKSINKNTLKIYHRI